MCLGHACQDRLHDAVLVDGSVSHHAYEIDDLGLHTARADARVQKVVKSCTPTPVCTTAAQVPQVPCRAYCYVLFQRVLGIGFSIHGVHSAMVTVRGQRSRRVQRVHCTTRTRPLDKGGGANMDDDDDIIVVTKSLVGSFS
jgi:hypothetical protein